MKALSLLQPWATLVVKGVKQVETRSWTTAYRGPLLIHASKGRAGRVSAGKPEFKQHITDFDELPFGCIIGRVTLAEILKVDADGRYINHTTAAGSTENEKVFGDYTPGRFLWILREPAMFPTPVAAKGNLALWEFDEALITV